MTERPFKGHFHSLQGVNEEKTVDKMLFSNCLASRNTRWKCSLEFLYDMLR